MTAPLRTTPRLSDIPASQNTAPVEEFRCLFTHDLRRKQKRWHDGFLKFHSFNSRVMVYDATRNFLGDTYWKDSTTIQEGGELTLDKGIMVEVTEAMGVTQTDLTPLFEKKTRQSPQCKRVMPAARAPPRPLLRHKSLNTLLGTPKGPIGKAAPLKSPYDVRKEKRQKIRHATISPQPLSPDPPLWPNPQGATIISLNSEPDYVPSDIILPSTPPGMEKPRPPPSPVPAIPPAMTKEVPIQLPKSKRKATPQPPPRSSSPPVSASNRLSNIDFALAQTKKARKDVCPPNSPLRDPRAKSLRLSTSNRRGLLLCQSLPQRAEPSEERPRKSKEKDNSASRFQPVPWPSDSDESLVQRKTSRSGATVNGKDRKRKTTSAIKNRRPQVAELVTSPQSSLDAIEDMTIIHGLMDQRLIVPKEASRPETRRNPSSPPAVNLPKPKPAKKLPPEWQSLSKVAMPKPAPTKRCLDRNPNPQEDVSPIGQSSRPTKSNPPPRNEPHPQTLSNPFRPSLSPCEPALSTVGFHKKPKRNQKLQPNSGSNAKPNPSPQKRTKSAPRLPPAPAVIKPASVAKLGRMSTTELSLLLDPIDDSSQPSSVSKSPNRPFRRVRSANDADPPVPSTVEEWEKRNLPNADANTTASTSNPAKPNTNTNIPTPPPKSGLAALINKTDPRRKFIRTQSLNVDTSIEVGKAGADVNPMLQSPPMDTDVGPWSTEAYDLFDWRPPRRVGDTGEGVIGTLVGI
ncbi:uncharacterized protein BDR25DRAFT_336820 [Lindgomyces ingoldianus]|uniref:Uncharacterized protein n=1 Tax=Lindgomyces ingoldianus TaxID=673940 RepID=A0ACB6QFK2_9PLEO|nr:uncharacterized protein BDR25DRAFT_336820 [Lindgomyces ingoldianus]KAF2465706.1 hypothetical protein BDR25DRAFT_336820 [Lindgomyces ingoldianus]